MSRQLTQRLIASLLLRLQPRQPHVLKPVLLLDTNGYSPFVNYVLQGKMLCKQVDIVDHTCKVSNYDEYILNYKPVKRILKSTLQEILGITTKEINKIFKDHPQLAKRSRANILNNHYNLIEFGVQKDTVINNIWLLAHENNKLIDKLECIKVLNMDNNQLVPWLCLTQQELANYVLYTQQDMKSYMYNRMEYLSHKLECSIQRLCEVTVLNSFLMKIPVSSIDKKLDILYEYNVSNMDVLKDIWVLRYSENHIRHRCELYKNTGKLKIKTWAVRCPFKIISRAIQKNKVERILMQHYETVGDYLQNKLNVNEEMLDSTVKKMPGILRVNIAKLDQLIDILHQNGITSDEILRHARIFYFNIETVQNRIDILRKEGLLPNLSVLVQAEQVFDQHIETNHIRQKFLQEHGSVKKYLIDKLNVDEKLFEKAVIKHPAILRVKIQKLIELIDVLRQSGIMGDEIVRHPKIFYFKTETLRKRIKTLKEKNIPPRINLIMRNQRALNQYIDRITVQKHIST